MLSFSLITQEEFKRINNSDISKYDKLAIISDMCRANTLTAVKIAGSGHLGSSLSAMDITVFLYYQVMNTFKLGINHPDRDIYFSSKGHDVPGFYSILYSLGILSKEKLIKLRRLGGLDGHPDVKIPGIECNGGSLGMGISKARGMMTAKRMADNKGKVFVLTGDGELQEGQIFEALQTTVQQKVNNLIVIVDHNKVQSDKMVKMITDLGELETKFQSFGWYVRRCDGHDFKALEEIINDFEQVNDKPKILIADTIKGKGISFMEHPKALEAAGGIYKWHAGAPDDESFKNGYQEIIERINKQLSDVTLGVIKLEGIPQQKEIKSGVSQEYVADAFGHALVKNATKRKDIVVLDADLAADCRIREFEEKYPERFIENGIAEQDMVSMAGGLALQGFLPVVNSFAAFLASRANEQIYTNASEGTRIIYVCHYAGIIPAGPGKSHQSVRDISLFGALPDFEIIQPCNAVETEMAVNYCINETKNNCMLRLIIGPSPQIIKLPENYRMQKGRGIELIEGCDGVLFSYGPVMLHEALVANEILTRENFSLKVVNMPWLNKLDTEWLADIIKDCPAIYVLEDHAPVGGLGDNILKSLVNEGFIKDKKYSCFAVDGYPACGTPPETLKYHGLDGKSITNRILTQ